MHTETTHLKVLHFATANVFILNNRERELFDFLRQTKLASTQTCTARYRWVPLHPNTHCNIPWNWVNLKISREINTWEIGVWFLQEIWEFRLSIFGQEVPVQFWQDLSSFWTWCRLKHTDAVLYSFFWLANIHTTPPSYIAHTQTYLILIDISSIDQNTPFFSWELPRKRKTDVFCTLWDTRRKRLYFLPNC